MIDFQENELILFKHLATSSKIEGEIFITSLRFVFHSNDSQQQKENKEWTWSNIMNIEYTPSTDYRTAIRIKTIIEGDKIHVIQLLGSEKEKRLQDFLEMKRIISDLRKTIPKPTTTTATSSSSSSLPSKMNKVHDQKLEELKKRLLEADRFLREQYQELVESKILTEEEFWGSHNNLLQNQQIEQYSLYQTKKGAKNFVLSDLMQRDEQGNVSIALTVEMKEMIFLRYPVVRKAFDHEVPTRITESEFWEKFFKAEFFNKSIDGRKEGIEEDQFFARYVNSSSSSSFSSSGLNDSTGTVGVADKGKEMVFLSKQKHRMKVPINQQIDLTTSYYGDYHQKDEVELVDNDLKDNNVGTSGSTEMILKRINDDSAFVLTTTHVGLDLSQEKPAKPNNQKSTSNEDEKEPFPELKKPEPPAYKIIDLSKLQSSNNNETSTFIPDGASVLGKRAIEELVRDFPPKSLTEYLPNAARGEKFFRNEINRLTKLESIRNHGNQQNLHHSFLNGSNPSDDPLIALLPEDIKQEMFEKYFEVTELLRHFYTLLGRLGNETTSNNAVISAKAKAIIDKLIDEKLGYLESKKKKVNESRQLYDEFGYEAIIYLINGISQLIRRAKTTWDVQLGY